MARFVAVAFPGEQVFPSDPSLRYYVEPAPRGSDVLAVGFSAIPAQGKPPAYNLVRTLRPVDHIHRLWILDDIGPEVDGGPVGCYYLGRNRTFDVPAAVTELVDAAAGRFGVPRANIVSFGSSKGGTAALWQALRNGWGHAIAGGPQILLGRYLIDQYPPYRAVARFVAGDDGPSGREWLDGLFPAALSAAPADIDLCVHVGRGDPHWSRHVEPFVGFAEAAGIPVRLDLAEYESHSELGAHYPDYLLTQLERIAPSPVGRAAPVL